MSGGTVSKPVFLATSTTDDGMDYPSYTLRSSLWIHPI